MKKIPNPQGKGQVPILACMEENRVLVSPPPKHIEQISNELFTSLFILNSRFQFKPVVGRPYWLYCIGNTFQLSLVSQQEWGGTRDDQYVGECMLQDDMSWTLELGLRARADVALMTVIEDRRRQFDSVVTAAPSVDELLPFYIAELPFYQRVFASVLASSLRESMVKSGIHGLDYQQAKGLIQPPQHSCGMAR